MSFVVDHIRRIDSQLDGLQLSRVPSAAQSLQSTALTDSEAYDRQLSSSRISQLQSLIKALSLTSSPTAKLLSQRRLCAILRRARLSSSCSTCLQDDWEGDDGTAEGAAGFNYEHELEWLLVSKVAVQAYGRILETILEQTIGLSEDIWYWDDVLSSYAYAGLYSIQTSPLRLWDWSKEIYGGVTARGGSLAAGWRHFYALVRDVVHDRSILNVQRQVVSPLSRVRNEGMRKQAALKRLRQMNANALGLLMGEGLSHESIDDDDRADTPDGLQSKETRYKWKTTVAKSIALMDSVLRYVSEGDFIPDKFDDAIAASTHEDPYYFAYGEDQKDVASLRPESVGVRLEMILAGRIPEYRKNSHQLSREFGRPSLVVRYWLPVSVLLISSSTILRILVNRKAEFVTWIREFGATVIDFWTNWVVEPTRKVIGTIRHDEGSEISIMSRKSLEGDRASLERMVVEFAVDNPESGSLNDSELADLRAKVKEGDLTPVLKAYEKDLKRPFIGAVRGNLIRALLIQIQKTKVDVEVAIGGIDSILKSQELVFGFIGLTPGVIVCIAVWRWLGGMFNNRKGLKLGRRQGQVLRILRNIDRVLASATSTDFGELYYKDHGLLLCEVHMLRKSAKAVLPRQVYREFLEEVEELVDVRTGVQRQLKVVERMRWAYSKWL